MLAHEREEEGVLLIRTGKNATITYSNHNMSNTNRNGN